MATTEQRAPRLRVHPLKNVEFRLESPEGQKPFKISNLSASGIGIVKTQGSKWPPVGQPVRGAIATPQQSVKVTVQIVHGHLPVVGGKFVDNLAEISAFVSKWFQTELRALKLTEVNPSVLKKPPRGNPRWFQDGHGNELYFVEVDGTLDYFRVVFLGNVVERLSSGTIRTGQVEGEERSGLQYKGSELVRDVKGIPPEIRSAAVSFVENVKGLDPQWKAKITGPIESAGG